MRKVANRNKSRQGRIGRICQCNWQRQSNNDQC
nr:MAG TPA: hypothetical protein [Caudoviricetes sp.]